MIKTIALLKRKPGLSREEFVEHYEDVHVPLIMKHSTGLNKYVRNHILALAESEEAEYDCITELWYEDMEAFKSSVNVWGTEAGKVIINDENRFIDRSKIVFFMVDERVSD
ncbi:MAG: EthD domain-containing protein [Chloroflexi bacterium]|nr:EthD domain-containing protein [Chloroflexota bacterium]